MAYNGLTDLGRTYLAKCLANQKPIIFKKVKVGDGSIPSHKTGQTTTELYSFKKDVEILAKEQQNTAMKLTVLLNNLDLSQGFYVKEMGIYIEDDGVDKLYWYINKDNPSYLYDKNTPSTHRYNVYCEVSSSESVVVNFTGQGLLADKKFVEDSINKAKSSLTNDFNTQLNKKLNKGNVSVEYDDAGKIEAKIKVAQETAKNAGNTANTKLAKGGLPAQIVDAKGIYDLLENNSGLNFDPNLLFLNNAGTKTQGKIYFDTNKKGLFKCIKTTTSTVNSTEFFEDISNNSNSDRLNNLVEVTNNDKGQSFSLNNLKIMCGKNLDVADGGEIYFPEVFTNTPVVLVNTDLIIGATINITTCVHAIYSNHFIVAHNYGRPQNIFWIAIGY